MKNIIILLVALGLTVITNAQGYTLKEKGYKGKVKSAIMPRGIEYFDINGRITKKETLNSENKPIIIEIYNHYPQALSVTEKRTEHYIYETVIYDSAGVTVELPADTTAPSNYIEIYDSAGKIIFSANTFLQGDPSLYPLDTLVKYSTFLYTFYVYNDKGLLKESITYEPGDSDFAAYLNFKNVYSYNSSSQCIERKIFRNDTAGNRIYIYEHDSKGLVIKETGYHNNEGVEYHTYEYSDNGNLIKKTSQYYGEKTSTVGYQYTYDKMGNITKKINLYSGGLAITEEYVFEYYP